MKKLFIYLSIVLLLSTNLFAQESSEGIKTWLEEQDGSPSVIAYKVKVNNASLTDNLDGTANLSSSGASTSATYLTATSEAGLSAEVNLGALSTGLLKGTVAGGVSTISAITDSSSNWDTAYTDRLKWDGGATGLVVATGRTSLELGTLATLSSIDISANTNLAVSTPITLTGDSVGMVNQGTTTTVLHGNAAGNPSFGAVVSGDITDATITYADIQNISASQRVLGRITALAGVTEELTGANIKTIIGDVALTTDTSGNYVKDVADGTGIDGTAAAEGATYTPTLDLTEINSATFGSGTFTTLTFDAGATDPIWTYSSGVANLSTGTLQAGGQAVYTVGGTDVAVADGGTGKSSWTQYLIPYADTTTSFSQIAIGTSGQVLTSNGAGVAPEFKAAAGGTQSKSFIITNPTSSADGAVWRAPAALTIIAIHGVQIGGTNIVGMLTECDANGLNPVVVDSSDMTITTSNVNDDGTLSNPSIDSGDYVGWATTSVSGNVSKCIITFEYQIP